LGEFGEEVMVAVPTNITLNLEFQDNRGFKSHVKAHLFFPDITADGNLTSAIYADSNAVIAAIAAMSNSKLVKSGFQYTQNYAQEPTSETGEYQLVAEKAHMTFGDGNGGFQTLIVPAPKDALFLTTTQDNLIVVNPSSSLVTAVQSAMATLGADGYKTPRLGIWGSQFFGGQFEGGKARRRRVLQGQ
jgi:hypothetical protein